MNAPTCHRELEVFEAVKAGRWPLGCEHDVLSHVKECSICAEIVLVAEALGEEHTSAEAPLPAAGFVWWKAQLCAKREATERALEPITLAEKVAAVCGVLALVASLVWLWPSLRNSVKNWGLSHASADIATSPAWHLGFWLMVVMGASVVLSLMAFLLFGQPSKK